MTTDLRETSVDEALAAFDPPDGTPANPGCYAIEIDAPDAGHERYERDWLAAYDNLPPYMDQLVEANRVVYVGAAKRVRARLEDHLASDVRKATLPSVWGVGELVEVWWFDSAERAFERERQCADELRHAHGSWYVHDR